MSAAEELRDLQQRVHVGEAGAVDDVPQGEDARRVHHRLRDLVDDRAHQRRGVLAHAHLRPLQQGVDAIHFQEGDHQGVEDQEERVEVQLYDLLRGLPVGHHGHRDPVDDLRQEQGVDGHEDDRRGLVGQLLHPTALQALEDVPDVVGVCLPHDLLEPELDLGDDGLELRGDRHGRDEDKHEDKEEEGQEDKPESLVDLPDVQVGPIYVVRVGSTRARQRCRSERRPPKTEEGVVPELPTTRLVPQEVVAVLHVLERYECSAADPLGAPLDLPQLLFQGRRLQAVEPVLPLEPHGLDAAAAAPPRLLPQLLVHLQALRRRA
mmetsp:Transcript_130193/g.404934  ORF Transcript_130193/g.404934 Transcript_130193/m.404934 type:complete len:321 (-) Transcript_130193:763-1725(-)